MATTRLARERASSDSADVKAEGPTDGSATSMVARGSEQPSTRSVSASAALRLPCRMGLIVSTVSALEDDLDPLTAQDAARLREPFALRPHVPGQGVGARPIGDADRSAQLDGL